MAHSPSDGNWKLYLLLVFLLIAGMEFLWRGPIRFVRLGRQWSDISQVYVPSRAWAEGLNPYSSDNFARLCREATGTSPNSSDIRTHSPYPLTTLVVMAPLAVLPWPFAQVLWATILGFTPVPIIWALVSFTGLTDRLNAYLFAGLTLALAPLHTGIAVGNVSIPAIAVAVLAVWAADAWNEIAAGLLLGLATCLKPQIGTWFIVFYAVQKRWRVVFPAAALVAAVAVLGILRLEISGAPWFSDFLHNARGFAFDNPTVDFSEKDPIRFTLIDLQVLAYTLSGSVAKARVSALVVGVVFLGIWFWLGFKSDRRPPVPLTLSALVVLSLLPAYHRNYDATVLAIPLCWILSRSETTSKMINRLALLLMLPFAIPGSALLQQLEAANRVPVGLVNRWWWNTLVMPHETWCLLLLSILLLCSMAHRYADVAEASSSRGG
jgi:Glycosyltransferase family 87